MALGLACAVRPVARAKPPPRNPLEFATRGATFALHSGELKAETTRLKLASRDGSTSRDIDLWLVVDDQQKPIHLNAGSLHADGDTLRAILSLPVADALVAIDLDVQADSAHDALLIKATAHDPAQPTSHRFAIRAELDSPAEGIFVSGVGQLAERATVSGNALVVDLDPHPVAVASAAGPVVVETISEESLPPGEPMRVSATGLASVQDHPPAELHVVLSESSSTVWRSLADLANIQTLPVHGRVVGTTDRSHVIGRDALGNPQVRALASEQGVFSLEVPASVTQWYAAIEPGRASALSTFSPGTQRDLLLEMSPDGGAHITVVDADTGQPLTARLLFHAMDGSVDPNFGPDYRASGAGPIIDSLRGDVTTPLPAGRYRIAATKGIEWSIDARIVDIVPGTTTEVALAPRHVVPTPEAVGCDLHVHARPSFDAPVTPEDRVLSLAAAGVDFAVPTEHNLVGDYSSAIETLDLGQQFISVPGVEVTTYSPNLGHFGVFPFPPGARVPPFRHANVSSIFRVVRTDSARYFQLNHPRLPGGIGYFNNIGFDPQAPRSHVRGRVDFDGIEVYNGFDIRRPERVEQVLRDYWALLDFGWRYTATGSSDSHRIQYQWAGYPRTMVALPSGGAFPDTQHVDPLAVVANLKKGHATVTSGPMIEFVLAGAQPGDEAVTTQDPIPGHLRIRAAPWIDVTSVEIVVGQIDGVWSVAQTLDVTARPTIWGSEPGTLEEAQARAVRLDRDIDISVGPANGWVMVIARGKRLMSDVLPFVPAPPFAFTNPVYVVRHHESAPVFPGKFVR